MSSTPSPKDWLILQCHACGSPMKVRAEAVAGQRVACPVCSAPVALQQPPPVQQPPPPPQQQLPAGAGVSPEFKAHMPQDADRVKDTQQRRAADFQSDTEFAPSPLIRHEPTAAPRTPDSASATGEGPGGLTGLKSTEDQSRTRVKVKKRRKNASTNHFEVLADWDTALQSLPEAELYSDPWLAPVPIPEEVIKEKSRDFIVEEEGEDGGTKRRIKRVRKRRLFSWAQLFFRRLSMGMRIMISTVVGAIALGGLYWGIMIFRERFKPVTYDEVVVKEREATQNDLTQQDESRAFDAVKAFLAAKGTEAKLPYVRLPNRVRPLMEKYYGRLEDRALEALEVHDRDKFATQGTYFVRLEVEVRDPAVPGQYSGMRHFAIEERADKEGNRTYLVDWETAVQWREMSFEDFKKDRPTGNVPFRIKLRGSDYYNHAFSDQKKWFATEVYYPHPGLGNETLFFGYMDRNSDIYRELSPMIEGGLCPAVIANIRYPANSLSPEQVVLDSLVIDSWFFVKDVPAKK